MFPPVGLEGRLLATLRWSVATAVGFAAAKGIHFNHSRGAKEISGIRYEYRVLCSFAYLKWTDMFFGSVLGIRSITLPKLSASGFGNQWL